MEHVRIATLHQLHLACLAFADKTKHNRERCIIVLSKAVQDWHIKQNKAPRSVQGSLAWSIKQRLGDSWGHILKTRAATVQRAFGLHGFLRW
eukprot:3029810-Lingulodinium_polyedra.AAC.1